jgi:hypothetical protein
MLTQRLSITGLPATVGTDGKLIATPSFGDNGDDINFALGNSHGGRCYNADAHWENLDGQPMVQLSGAHRQWHRRRADSGPSPAILHGPYGLGCMDDKPGCDFGVSY